MRLQHERITSTRNGEAEAVLLSIDDLDGLEMSLEILSDSAAVARISESLAALDGGEPGVSMDTVRADRQTPFGRMTAEDADPHEVRFQPAARRAISHRLPETVAAAVLEFCDAALAIKPRKVGKPLFGPLAGCFGARRGTYRMVYRIDEQSHSVQVIDIDHRADIYRRS